MNALGNKIIKIVSLTVGLSAAMVLIAKVCFELSYDGFYKDADRIYTVYTEGGSTGEPMSYAQVSGGVAPGFKAEIPGVEDATRYTNVFDSDHFCDEDGGVIEGILEAVDTSYFRIFDRPFIAGNPMEALRSWNGSVAVSRSFADKLGGPAQAVGKTVYNESLPMLKFSVCGVFEDFPSNSSVSADLVVGIEAMSQESRENWLGNDRYHAYVKLLPGVDPQSLAQAIHAMQEKHQDLEALKKNGVTLTYVLKPFSKAHVRESRIRSLIFILSVVSVLLLLVAVLNYILVAIGDVLRRSKEMAVRKCYGAFERDIHGLLLRETALDMTLSVILSILLILSFRGPVVSLLGVSLADLLMTRTLVILAVVIVLSYLLSSLVPAHIFSSIPISSLFRGYREAKRKWKLTLLCGEIFINVVLAILLCVISLQYHKSLNSDMGYDYENLAYIDLPGLGGERLSQLCGRISDMAGVEDAAMTYSLPMRSSSGNNVSLPGSDEVLFNVADQYGSTYNFFSLMGFRLLEGNAPAGPKDVAVSKSFEDNIIRHTGWKDGVVGKSITMTEHSNGPTDVFDICGVYEDYVIGTAQDSDSRPSVRFCFDRDFDYSNSYDWSRTMNTIVVKFKELTAESMKEVMTVTAESAPENHNELTSYAQTLEGCYANTLSMRRTYTIGSLLALLLALVGLIGYVRDESFRRSAEIAVRKVNGARPTEIIRMMGATVLKVTAVAVVLGDIVAVLASWKWLAQFSAQVAVSPWIIIFADLLVAAVVIATVAVCSSNIARSNPVESLRDE